MTTDCRGPCANHGGPRAPARLALLARVGPPQENMKEMTSHPRPGHPRAATRSVLSPGIYGPGPPCRTESASRPHRCALLSVVVPLPPQRRPCSANTSVAQVLHRGPAQPGLMDGGGGRPCSANTSEDGGPAYRRRRHQPRSAECHGRTPTPRHVRRATPSDATHPGAAPPAPEGDCSHLSRAWAAASPVQGRSATRRDTARHWRLPGALRAASAGGRPCSANTSGPDPCPHGLPPAWVCQGRSAHGLPPARHLPPAPCWQLPRGKPGTM